MHRYLVITSEPIDENVLRLARRVSTDVGAVVDFLGLVRGSEQAQPIAALDYESFTRMAHHQFELIFQRIESTWPVMAVSVVHRVGRVAAGEPSLWVEVVSAHRKEAFAACLYLIDEMKKVVPIWKKAVPAR